jgi:hypothetical protein
MRADQFVEVVTQLGIVMALNGVEGEKLGKCTL